jgi:hypothetical protein
MKRHFLLGLLLAPLLAIAGSDKSFDLDKVVEQQQQIREDLLAAGGKYRGMSSAQQAELMRRQDRLFRMFEGKETDADLSVQERMDAFNDLEWIEAALNKGEEGDRLVCTRERTVGSNRVTRVCRTQEQIDFEREQGRDDLLRSQRNGRL